MTQIDLTQAKIMETEQVAKVEKEKYELSLSQSDMQANVFLFIIVLVSAYLTLLHFNFFEMA